MSRLRPKNILNLAGGVLLAGLAGYAADWLAWQTRAHRGDGMAQVQVSRVSVASLKGNKEEYYADQTTEECSRSWFPMPDTGHFALPCWWLRRHPVVVERD